jgi:hypothetical protein
MTLQSIETAHGKMFVEYANAPSSETPIDLQQVIKTGDMPATTTNKTAVAKALLEIDSWLPFAAESYNISANIKDFLIVPCTIFLTDIPNANLAAFPFEEMSKWNPQAGQISYKTWVGKPVFKEHKNDNPEIASGIIFDSSLRSVSNYIGNLHRVVLLTGWDRNRYPEEAKIILKGRSAWSMGAYVSNYHCGCCGASFREGPCTHFHSTGQPKMLEESGKLVYRIARGVQGFECSAVLSPAWRGAWGTRIDSDEE